ncbi:hypothetical protein [Sphingomonas sp. MMS24-J13]|uniref:hypothetical protein n=1 Tax=Sphingomonas sp. MMS24-J13 TaxID=3238686 RepID=UPI00384CD736
MTVDELKNAAELADSLSRSRHKKVRLVLTSAGILIDGELIRADDVVIQRYRAEQPWGALDVASLETLVRDVDSKLVYDWTNAGPAKEP